MKNQIQIPVNQKRFIGGYLCQCVKDYADRPGCDDCDILCGSNLCKLFACMKVEREDATDVHFELVFKH